MQSKKNRPQAQETQSPQKTENSTTKETFIHQAIKTVEYFLFIKKSARENLVIALTGLLAVMYYLLPPILSVYFKENICPAAPSTIKAAFCKDKPPDQDLDANEKIAQKEEWINISSTAIELGIFGNTNIGDRIEIRGPDLKAALVGIKSDATSTAELNLNIDKNTLYMAPWKSGSVYIEVNGIIHRIDVACIENKKVQVTSNRQKTTPPIKLMSPGQFREKLGLI